ncbi:MAG: hypothetical protein HY656_07100 [Acidobacteria bacterium]|nr:hypothetical protein [Acidobacteriota bacterium]
MTAEPAGGDDLSTRLQKISTELRELEQSMKSGDIEPRVLREFRDAVDHVRQTAWAVQQWLELQAKRGDVYSVLSLLTLERIRRATQLSTDLSIDLDAAEVSFETEGLEKLWGAVRGLSERLARLFKK